MSDIDWAIIFLATGLFLAVGTLGWGAIYVYYFVK